MRTTTTGPNERGMALVIAMLVLLVLSLLSITMMAGVAVNREVAGKGLMLRKALNTADAGVGEAISHLRNGDAQMSIANPRSTAQIFLAPAGSVPVVGVDTTAIPTGQPAGAWLPYSTANKSPNVLTINYKTNTARTLIYRYDTTRNPAIQTSSGLPIYQITSTGTAGTAKRTIVAEVIAKPIYAMARGGLSAGMGVDYVGNAVVCGYNHSANTPPGTGANGKGSAPDCTPYEIGSGDLVATWATGAINPGGTSHTSGAAPVNSPNQTGFYAGPWQMLGMTQAEFLSYMGAPVTNPASLNGIVYVDNDVVMGNQSSGAAFHGATGEGMLYVDGDLTLNAGFTYVGLIYVEGDLKLNGQAWILGAMVVRGKAKITVNGGATILYSSDAITQKLAQYSGAFTTLSWREL